ncbi:MAG: hypothetical protein ACHQ5A_00720, partial [Opitutales bacterium]
LQTSAMGVQNYSPVSYTMPIDSTGDLPDPHTMIERPSPPSSTDPYYTAKTQVEAEKLSAQAGLYIQVTVTPGVNGTPDTYTVNAYGPPSGVSGTPNGGAALGALPAGLVTVIPYQLTQTGTQTQTATKYTYGTTGSGSSWKYTTTPKTGMTASTPVTQVVNASGTSGLSATGGAAYSGGSNGSTTNSATTYTSSAAALAAAPGGGATSYTLSGSASNSFASSNVNQGLYDQRQQAGVNVVQVDLSALRAALTDANANSNTDTKAIVDSSSHVWGSTAWNGGVYVDVNAPAGNQTSVALANGRVASGSSLLPTVNSTTGLTVATNAPVYILGNLNADGNTATGNATTPDDGRTNAPSTATSSEIPVAVMADAITILSPGYFSSSISTLGSAAPTANTSGTNAYNSFSTLSPGAANGGLLGTGSANAEIAAAFVTGLVPTSSSASSGGVHNLPRFLENWGGYTVLIRGSLVAMYNTKTATGTFNGTYYSPPTRSWGFDSIFQNGTYPPLTPRVMSYRRIQFGSLSAAAFTAALHSLWPTEY